MTIPRITNELDFLQSLVPLADTRLVEAGCGAAHLARELVSRHPTSEVVGIEVDDRQLAKNLLAPVERLRFEKAGPQAVPFPDAFFDGALMLQSLHHVPMPLMDQALAELARVLHPGGWLYVSEPVHAGALNALIRLFNDECEVRAAAQAALDRAVASGRWASAADHGIDAAMVARVRSRYAPHQGPDGARFIRPMHVRLLRKTC